MMDSRPSDRATLGELIDNFVASCPAQPYGQALRRPAVRRYLVNYVLQRIQWHLPPQMLEAETGEAIADPQPPSAAFRDYIESAIYWGLEEIIGHRLDLCLSEVD
jgi:hypothetical protein